MIETARSDRDGASLEHLSKVFAEMRGWRRDLPAFGIVCLLTLVIYSPVRNFDFIDFDDNQFVLFNPWLRQGFLSETIGWAFGANLLYFSEFSEHWMPVTLLSRVLDVSLFGYNPGGHHLMNLVWHLAAAAALFAALRMLTGVFWRPFLVTVLFAIHPLHVEDVAWIVARKDLLAGMFFHLTLLAYAWYVRGRSVGRYCLLVSLYICCLMSKSMGVTLPFVLLLLDIWPLQRIAVRTLKDFLRSISPALVEKIPLFLLAGAAAWIAYHVQHGLGAVLSASELPFQQRLANCFVSYLSYLWKTICPVDMAFLYPHAVEQVSFFRALAGFAVVTAVASAAIYWREKRGWLGVGWFWFLGTLFPVIGVVQLAAHAMADRFSYIPLTGLFILLAWGLAELMEKCSAGTRKIIIAGSLALLAVEGVVARIQVETWRNTETLARHAIQVTPTNDAPYVILASYYFRLHRYPEAAEAVEQAISINPAQPQTYFLRGGVALMQGRDRDALPDLEKAVALFPEYPEALTELGSLYRKFGELDRAAAALTRSAELRPKYAKNYYELSLLFEQAGKSEEAAALRKKAEALDVSRGGK